jgi:predicted enzyme related to lactoylglutathione lyase
MSNPVVHFEVVGKDARALQSFYKDAFDWQIEAFGPEYGMARPGGEGINGGIGATPDGSSGHVTFYVEVEDLDAMLSKIESLGGGKVMGPMDVPNGPTIALFTDPEGHVVGLVGSGSRSGG